uniref:uncharacterized protein LOC122583450 n=1 Tax=Erigeron canadensis TaxID=72917 RepID=UPI001CB97495|nr:uncharacterized protein LOC122583450 [Erigeron canadensis]
MSLADVRTKIKLAFEGSQKPKQIRGDGTTRIQEEQTASTQRSVGTKRKASSTSDNAQSYFPRGAHDTSQPSLKSVWQSKERVHDTDLAVAMWIYDACIPMNAINSPLLPIAMSKVASMGHGYTGPSYHAVRVSLLKDAKQSVKLIVDSYREYCDIVEIVGSKNIVHLVTDNAANHKAAGRLLSEKYPLISWSPCAAHCINLIMKDVSEIPEVANLIQLASRITVFMYNHKWPLNWLRKRPGWTEIIRPGATRFGTSFIALKSLCDHKSDLQALVTSNDFKKMLKMPKAKDVRQTILEDKFWQNCLITVKVMSPILRLLRVCDSDEKPSLGYVFEGMLRVKNGLKELFQRKKRLYKQYVDIVDARWDKMLRKSLHAAAYWLNLTFQYERDNREEKQEGFEGVLDMLEKMSEGNRIYISDLAKFRDKTGGFGRPLALALVDLSLCLHIDRTEFWVVEEEPTGELDYDELENMIDEEPPANIDPSQTQAGQNINEDDDLILLDDDDEVEATEDELDDL